jgi:hypothetical protein
VKWSEREADHSPSTSAEVKKTWIYTSTPPYTFMAQCCKVGERESVDGGNAELRNTGDVYRVLDNVSLCR